MTTMLTHGTKYTCSDVSCQTKFYDLNKPLPVCPKCGLAVAITKTRTRRTADDSALKAKRKKWQ